jgi:hypothetical protein
MRHPAVGGDLWNLLEGAGCDVLDRVEELSVWRSLNVLDVVLGLAASVERAVNEGRTSRSKAAQWIETQRAREVKGAFFATIPKILVVARKR